MSKINWRNVFFTGKQELSQNDGDSFLELITWVFMHKALPKGYSLQHVVTGEKVPVNHIYWEKFSPFI